MRTRIICCLIMGHLIQFFIACGSGESERRTSERSEPAAESGGPPYQFEIVDMIPADRSDEARHDGEPNIAVNPLNTQVIAASAFTLSANRRVCDTFPCPRVPTTPFNACRAPIYFSSDGGRTWHLEEVIHSKNGITHDITVAFSDSGYLYAAALKGCQYSPAVWNKNIMRGLAVFKFDTALNNVRPGQHLSDLRQVDQRFGYLHDQPWVVAINAPDPGTRGTPYDHVFVGINKVADAAISSPPSQQDPVYLGRTARVLMSDRRGIFTSQPIETQLNNDKNPAAVRLSVHPSGKVYVIFYRTTRGEVSPDTTAELTKVVVLRDDAFATGTEKFGALTTAGKIVADSQLVPAHYLGDPGIGGQRLATSHLTIAVDPSNDRHVFIGWCALNDASYTLNCRESWDGGEIWNKGRLPTVPNAINPAIAVTSDGRVGILYQQLVPDRSGEEWWETHFVMMRWNRDRVLVPEGDRAGDHVLSRFRRIELNLILATGAPLAGTPAIGDYLDLVAVRDTFYGVFSAMNITDSLSGPHGRFPTEQPFFQRYRNARGELVSSPGSDASMVINSVDPFFFRVTRRRAR